MTHPPLQVGIVAHSLNHNNIGRVYPFVQALAAAPGVHGTLIGWDDGSGLFPLLNDLPWPLVRLRGTPSTAALVHALAGCQIVHCFKNTSHFLVVLAAARECRLPLVLDLDDWELGLYLEGVAGWPRWRQALSGAPIARRIAAGLRLETLARSAADALVVNSRALQGHFGGQIIYTAADAAAFDPARGLGPAFRARHGIPPTAPLLGFPGTPHPHKGIDDLLAAFALLSETRPDLRLLVVGVPNHNRYAERLRSTPGVVATGYVAADEYPAVYAACDMIALPQRAVTEGIMQTPAKLLLAMAAGRPIVASSVGDMPAILGDAGLLVPPASPRALAAALAELLDAPERRAALGNAARARFCAAHTLEHTREAVLAIYARLLATEAAA